MRLEPLIVLSSSFQKSEKFYEIYFFYLDSTALR